MKYGIFEASRGHHVARLLPGCHFHFVIEQKKKTKTTTVKSFYTGKRADKLTKKKKHEKEIVIVKRCSSVATS